MLLRHGKRDGPIRAGQRDTLCYLRLLLDRQHLPSAAFSANNVFSLCIPLSALTPT